MKKKDELCSVIESDVSFGVRKYVYGIGFMGREVARGLNCRRGNRIRWT